MVSAGRNINAASRRPSVRAGIVSPAGDDARISTPHNHLVTGPDCGKAARSLGALIMLVAVQLSVPGLYFPPVLHTKSSRPLELTITALKVWSYKTNGNGKLIVVSHQAQ